MLLVKVVRDLVVVTLFAAGLFGCAGLIKNEAPSSLFAVTDGIVPFDKEMRRKWGTAVIADLDQNGWQDIVTTQHGTNALIYWNDKGVFSQPSELITGDTHGLGVADYDRDGNINIVVSQGGGDGGNPRRPVYFSVDGERNIKRLGTFSDFKASRGRSVKFIEANKDENLDLFLTGFAPKKVKALTTNQLYFNQRNQFTNPATLTIAKDAMSMKAITTDVNNDGVMDVISFGGRDLTLSIGNGDGTYRNGVNEAFGELAKTKNVNNITEIDYDNDGDFDLFLARAPFQFLKEAYYDPESKNFAFFIFRQQFLFEDLEIQGENLVLDNIQETWATYDIHLGKERKIVEAQRTAKYTGGRLEITPEQAIGWPEGEKLKGLHIGYIGEGKWRIGGLVKSRLTAVVKNVISSPQEIKRPPLPAKLFENRDGKFFDVTEQLGIDIQQQITSAAPGDINNDGYMDLAISPYGNMAKPIEHLVLMNDQGKGFKLHKNSGLLSEEVGATSVGVTAFDYDHDGRVDIVFGNERGRWYLAENQLSSTQLGNHISLKVNVSPKHKAQPIGARVNITACGMNQSQLVGSGGDGFHQMFNTRVHFGIGNCELVDEATVTWSNGEQQTLTEIQAGSHSEI